MKVKHNKQNQRNTFKRNPVAAAIVLALAAQFPVDVAYANGSWGTNTDITGATINVPTYYANSPQGVQPAFDLNLHGPGAATVDTGTALRKFVDPLTGVGGTAGIPLAVPEKWFNPLTNVQTADDYYEIAVVAYTQQMHTDLPKPTSLRGYVQLSTAKNPGKKIPLFYPDGITPILDATGVQVLAYDNPHYMGPIIIASRGTAVRIKYTNYLPYNDANGAPVGAPNGGEIPIPVDEYTDGGGPAVDKNGKPIKFTQNRANIHWHGGDTPWISDGTPHQWVAPAGETVAYAAGIGKGASARSVPDMPDPGPGSETLYFPNNLSARLMFYHDHTSGMTKLNVYEGIAAGYVVTDPVEQGLVAAGVIPNTLGGVGIPLVIQDKTFVPKNIGAAAVASDGTPQSQDAKWDLAHWGQPGDLWFPHVYETNQDPNSIDGTNPVGRWDWGPWFWPVFPAQYSLPTGNYGDVTATPEAFMDTPIVNGQAYPTMTVDPTAVRFRILSVPNDRSMNYGIYQAVDANGKVCDAANTAPAVAAPDALHGQSLPLAACTEVRMVAASPTYVDPTTGATMNMPASWPMDGRNGGVPDPATAGPDIIQIGNEAGFLPAPAIWKAQPVTFDQNVRSMTVLNVLNHQLLLGAAERADVIVDFSKYAGQTLILYNDAPAPMPGFDPRIDYFTGVGDQSGGGGAYDTPAGYGPNTRTVMQIKVNSLIGGAGGTPPSAPFNVAALAAALPVAYKASQPAPNIPEAVYNAAMGTSDTNNYAQIYTGAATQPNFQWTPQGIQTVGAVDPVTGLTIPGSGVTVVAGGNGYTSAPTVVFSAPPVAVGNAAATAVATIDPVLGSVTGITVTSPGVGYTALPTVSLVGGGGANTILTVQTSATITKRVINKAIQELFDPVYGRMNATLAVELPFTTSLTATTIPLAYIDTPVEAIDAIKDGETQIWKITHNGVDSHPVHFHLVNVQVINRVDWAGVVKPPEANEVGWKEVLRMNPLEDVFVAARAVHPVVPFGLPQSIRPLDPTQVIGGQLGFTQIDPLTGNAPATPYSNVLTNFDNEYVWHCHILGHEENDFMRPFIFHPNVTVPDAPTGVTVAGSTVTWTDTTPYGGVDLNGIPTAGISVATGYAEPTSNPKNEIGFKIVNAAGGTIATVPANVTTWTDPTGSANLAGASVVAYNVAGDSVAANIPVAVAPTAAAIAAAQAAAAAAAAAPAAAVAAAGTGAAAAATAAGIPAAPIGLTQTVDPLTGDVTVNWTASAGATSYIVTYGSPATTATVLAPLTTFLIPAANANGNVSVVAVGTGGSSQASAGLYNGVALVPVAVTATTGITTGSVTLTWANNPLNVNNVSNLQLTWTNDAGVVETKLFAPSSTGVTVGDSLAPLTTGKTYSFTLVALSTIGNSPVVTVTAAAK